MRLAGLGEFGWIALLFICQSFSRPGWPFNRMKIELKQTRPNITGEKKTNNNWSPISNLFAFFLWLETPNRMWKMWKAFKILISLEKLLVFLFPQFKLQSRVFVIILILSCLYKLPCFHSFLWIYFFN